MAGSCSVHDGIGAHGARRSQVRLGASTRHSSHSGGRRSRTATGAGISLSWRMAPTATERRDLAFAGVARQAELVRGGEVTPRELVETALERIGRARSAAQRLSGRVLRARAAGGRPGHGSRPRRRRAPAARRADRRQGRHAGRRHAARARLRRATATPRPRTASSCAACARPGAIVIGVTRTPELMLWPFTETAARRRDPQPVGSRAHARRLERRLGRGRRGRARAGATASDGAGSIRIPAACCGLFGLKIQRGRVSIAPWTRSGRGSACSAS